MVAEKRGEVASRQGPKSVIDNEFDDGYQYDILLVPGGKGTRMEVKNEKLMEWLVSIQKKRSMLHPYVQVARSWREQEY